MLNDAHSEDIATRLTAIEQRVDGIVELVEALHASLADLLAPTATVDGPAGEHAEAAYDQTAPVCHTAIGGLGETDADA